MENIIYFHPDTKTLPGSYLQMDSEKQAQNDEEIRTLYCSRQKISKTNFELNVKHIMTLIVWAFFVFECQSQIPNDNTDISNLPHRRAHYYETYLEISQPIDSIVIYKEKREMLTFHQGQKVKLYMISLGMEPIGPKQFEGDMKTPEGLYYINERDSISSYHKNLGISYPNEQDSLFAVNQGLSPGGEIKIHGFPNHHNKSAERELTDTDWTLGCIAITDFEIDELFIWVKENCPILILP